MSLWNTLKNDWNYLKAKVTPPPSFQLPKVSMDGIKAFGQKLQPMVSNTVHFVQKNPTPYSFVAPKVKNYFSQPAENIAKNIFMATTPFGSMNKVMNDPRSPLANYFKPVANQVRARDIVRETPNSVWEAAKQVPQFATRFGVSAAEAFNPKKPFSASGKYYNTPFGRLNSFQSEAQNRVRRGDPMWKAIGNPALETILAGADVATVAKPVLGMVRGAKYLPNEIRNIAGDLLSTNKNYMPISKSIKFNVFGKPMSIGEIEEEIIKRNRQAGNSPMFGEEVQKEARRLAQKVGGQVFTKSQLKDNFNFQSNLMKGLQRPGLTIEDVSLPSGEKLLLNSGRKPTLKEARKIMRQTGEAVDFENTLKPGKKPFIFGETGGETKPILIKGKDGIIRPIKVRSEYTAQPGEIPQNMGTLRKLFTGGDKILNRSGRGGKQLAQALQSQRKSEDLLRGGWNVHIDKALGGLSESEISNVDRVLRGEAKPINAKTAGASKSLRNWFDSIGKKAETMGFQIQNSKGEKTPFKMRTDYAPQMYDFTELQKGAQRDKALQHLVSSGQARNLGEATKLLDNFIKLNAERRFGNLERAREIHLPGFIRDPRIYAKKYAQSIAKRFSEVEHFGMKDSKAARYIDQIAQEGGDYNEAQRIFDYTAKGAPQNKVINAATQFNLATQLDLSAITNATQSINTAAKAGIMNTVKGAAQGFTKKGKEVAELAGVYDDFIHSKETGVNLNKVVRAVMWPFQKVENFNRRTAANAGAIRAQKLAEGELTDYAVRELQKLGINPANIKNGRLSKDDMLSAAYEMARQTQFKVDPVDVPPAWKTPAGKLFSQFQSFSFMQSKFIRDEILKEAKQGNFAPLVRFIPLAIAASYATNYVRNIATGRDPNQANKDMDIRAWDKWGKAFGDFATGKIIQGKFLYDTFANDYNSPLKKVSRVASSIGGPTVGKAGAILTGLESMQKGFEDNAKKKIAIAKGTAEATDPYLEVKRYASGEIPFIGEMIKNKAFAYPKSKYSPEQKAQFAKDEMKQEINAILIGQQRGTITPEQAQNKIQKLQKDYSDSVGLIKTANAATTIPEDKGYVSNPTGGFSYFDTNGNWKTAKTEKQARIGAAKTKFAESDKSIMDLGDTILRKASDGTIQQVSKVKYLSDRIYAQSQIYKNLGNYEQWRDLAKKQRLLYQYQLQDPMTDDVEALNIQKRIMALDKEVMKYYSYGAFKKGKKAPKMPKSKVKYGATKLNFARPTPQKALTLGQLFKGK